VADNYDDYSKEELIRELRAKNQKPRFGLYWERDDIEHERAINTDFVALDLDESLSCGDAPYANLIIEGDNFDALRYLRMTFAGKVKCIYIDPPYNTGNKDFVYNDRFIDKDDVYKHSKWLEFMYRRLELARDLLAEDGVLLVSINDENRAKLELLLDGIFQGMRFGSFAWRTKDTGNDSTGNFSAVHEHILIYALGNFAFNGNALNTQKYRNPDNDPNGRYALNPITCSKTYKERPNLYYPIQNSKTGYWYPCDSNTVWRYATDKKMNGKIRTETIETYLHQELIVFPECKLEDTFYYETKEELLAAIRQGTVPVLPQKKTPLLREDLPDLDFWIGKRIATGRPSKKAYLNEKTNLISPVSSWIGGVNEDFDEEDEEAVFFMRSQKGREGTDAINEILGAKAFNYPKPPSLITELLRQASKPNDIILDFFAGSGTTAQAVLKLNAEDGGSRRFILASNTESTESEPDKNICRDVCAERVRRVIHGYSNKKNIAGLGGNFAYLKTRRIASEILLSEIQHSQIWTALQLSHGAALSAFNPHSSVQQLQTENDVVMYLCKLTEQELTAVTDCLQTLQTVIVYCWQPALLTQYIEDENLTCLPIPQILIDRFATGVKA
jgi:adenine-specific DNA-methyltransferase